MVFTTYSTTKNRRNNNYVAKYWPIKALQWHATCSKKLTMENVIEETVLTGPSKSEAALISRIPMIPTNLPFQFKRLQFSIQLAFVITINKAQEKTLENAA